MDEKKKTKTQVLEKVQDISRDVFVTLLILIVFVVPTIYIGVRAFQPMTLPGYENISLAEFIQDQFLHRVADNLQTYAFLEVLVSPYAATIDVFSQLNIRNKQNEQTLLSWKEIPNAWWLSIEKYCVFWINRAAE
jgi:hypothetical protein